MKTLCYILIGGLLAGAVATFLSPKLLTWYATPPVPIGVSCDGALSWAMEKLILFQIMGLLGGGVLGAIISFRTRPKPVKVSSTTA